jgi:hypothetical protein
MEGYEMTLYHGFDASLPPKSAYPGTDIVAGYIGGDTPHVWTLNEWRACQGNNTPRRVLPIWTADFSKNAVTSAIAAGNAMRAFGWNRGGRLCALDSETSLNVLWIQNFEKTLDKEHSFATLDYRSLEALVAAPSGLPEWVAHWNSPPGPWTGKQYAYQYKPNEEYDGTTIDLDVFDSYVWGNCGQGLRHHVST